MNWLSDIDVTELQPIKQRGVKYIQSLFEMEDGSNIIAIWAYDVREAEGKTDKQIDDLFSERRLMAAELFTGVR